jgi:hypothetical protein
MSSDEVLSPELVDATRKAAQDRRRQGDDLMSVHPMLLDRLTRSHEALRAELDLYRSIALRYADMWQPQFPLDPNEGLWVFPWADDVPDEPMTPEQREFYRKRQEARR